MYSKTDGKKSVTGQTYSQITDFLNTQGVSSMIIMCVYLQIHARDHALKKAVCIYVWLLVQLLMTNPEGPVAFLY